MKEISVLFQSKSTLAKMALLGVLVFTTYNIQENSNKIKKLSTFDSGMQTCYGRVNQTYTAKLLEDLESNYLTQGFQSLTEECFAESVITIEDNFKSELAVSLKKMNNLASQVHWFHEGLTSSGDGKLVSGEGKDVGSRFETIENQKDEILEEVDSLKTKVTNDLNSRKNIFYATSTLLIVLMVMEYLSNTKRRISNNAREIEAGRELLDNGGVNSVKVGEIVRSALEQNELANCAKLFNNYYVQATFDKSVKNKNKNALDNLTVPTMQTTNSRTEANIDKMWNDDSIAVAIDTTSEIRENMTKASDLNLDQSISKVIDHLAEKLFSKGIQLEVNVDEKITIMGQEEALEQILFHAFQFAISTTGQNATSKKIGINALKLGDLVALDINNSGSGFESNLLKAKVGLETAQSELDLDLQICQTLVSEIGGKMQFDNRIDQSGLVSGARIKLILKSGEYKTSKLVDLKKGSKKELMAQMGTSV